MTISALAAHARPPSGWRLQLPENYLQKWIILGVLIGIVAGVGAIAFFAAIDWATKLFLGYFVDLHPPVPAGEGTTKAVPTGRIWLLPIITTVGGLISGLIVFTLAPEAEGHGTDAAIEAFHQRAGKIRSRIPPIKLIASAITIGSGGSAGREGPTAQIAAGFGSWMGDVFRLTPQDRRIAVAVGVGAGIGAIFKAPLGGAILAAEILYVRDFELEAIVPGFIASVVGYSIFGAWAGWTPVFGTGLALQFEDPQTLFWYAILGVLCGLVGIAYVKLFYGTRDAFQKLRIPNHVKPAIGGLAVGLIGLAYPQAISMGYGWLQFAIEGNTAELAVGTMLALIALKIIATSFTIGSGGSGGVFAPGLFIGGMVGGALWGGLHNHVMWMPAQSAPFVIVGMMALFGGVAKAPIAVMLMVAEMTNEVSMVVPAMIAVTLAYLITDDTRIYENQVVSRADSPAHRGEFAFPLVQTITVSEAMRRGVITVAPSDTIERAEAVMAEHGRRGLPVIASGRLGGMFTQGDALRARQNGQRTVGEVMSSHLVVAHPSESLHTALQRMARSGVSRLPIVERDAPDMLLGILSIRDLALALDMRVGALAADTGRTPLVPADDPLRSVLVEDAMTDQYEAVPASLSLKRVANLLASANQPIALVVDDDDESLRGIVSVRDIERAAQYGPDQTAGQIASAHVIFTRPRQTVAEAFGQPGAEALRQLPVMQERDGKLRAVGLLRRSDVLAAYLRGRDRQGRIARRAHSLAEGRGGDVVTLELTVRASDPVAHRKLAELRLPSDAVITAVIRDGTVLVPRGQVQLETGDRVQILTATASQEEVFQRFRTGNGV